MAQIIIYLFTSGWFARSASRLAGESLDLAPLTENGYRLELLCCVGDLQGDAVGLVGGEMGVVDVGTLLGSGQG